jgi:hypothetical protein
MPEKMPAYLQSTGAKPALLAKLLRYALSSVQIVVSCAREIWASGVAAGKST